MHASIGERINMKTNFIVTFFNQPQVMFDVNLMTKGVGFEAMKLQMQLAAYLRLTAHGYDAEEVWKISTCANWTDTWCKEHGSLPSDFPAFNGKFFYLEDMDSLTTVLEESFDLDSFPASLYAGRVFDPFGAQKSA